MTGNNIHITYDEIHAECVDTAKAILKENIIIPFDYIIGLSRGGIIPSSLFSRVLKVPLKIVEYSSHKGNGETQNVDALDSLPIIRNKRLFIVDDICDTAHTLHDISQFYEKLGNDVTTYAVFYKERPNSIHVPLHSFTIDEDAGWVIFPWELE